MLSDTMIRNLVLSRLYNLLVRNQTIHSGTVQHQYLSVQRHSLPVKANQNPGFVWVLLGSWAFSIRNYRRETESRNSKISIHSKTDSGWNGRANRYFTMVERTSTLFLPTRSSHKTISRHHSKVCHIWESV